MERLFSSPTDAMIHHRATQPYRQVRMAWIIVLAGVFSAGCDYRPKTFPVDGRVVFSDGTPVSGGTVEFITEGPDGKMVNARGMIDDRGNFALRTSENNDGALPGEHRAIVVRPSMNPSGNIAALKPTEGVAVRFQNYDTSGLKFTVEPKANHFTITVAKEE